MRLSDPITKWPNSLVAALAATIGTAFVFSCLYGPIQEGYYTVFSPQALVLFACAAFTVHLWFVTFRSRSPQRSELSPRSLPQHKPLLAATAGFGTVVFLVVASPQVLSDPFSPLSIALYACAATTAYLIWRFVTQSKPPNRITNSKPRSTTPKFDEEVLDTRQRVYDLDGTLEDPRDRAR